MTYAPSLLCAGTSSAPLSCEDILKLGWLPWLHNTLPIAGCYLLGGVFVEDRGDDNIEARLHMMTNCLGLTRTYQQIPGRVSS